MGMILLYALGLVMASGYALELDAHPVTRIIVTLGWPLFAAVVLVMSAWDVVKIAYRWSQSDD